MFNYSNKTLNFMKKPFMVKVKNYSTFINEKAIEEFTKILSARTLTKDSTKISFPVFINVLYELYLDKTLINEQSLTEMEIKHLLCKISTFCEKFNIINLYQMSCQNTYTWYINKNNFMSEELNHKLSLNASFEELNEFISWGIKRHHNLLFQDIHNCLSFIENKLNINKSFSINTGNLCDSDIYILNKYIPINENNIKQGKRAKYINANFLIQQLISDETFRNHLSNFDQLNKKKYSLQIVRYIKEIIIYLRMLDIFEHLVVEKYVVDEIKINIFNNLIKRVKDSVMEDYISAQDLYKISNKLVTKIIKIMNMADDYYFDLICKNEMLMLNINTDLKKFINIPRRDQK